MIKKIKNIFLVNSAKAIIFKNFFWLFAGNVGSRFFKAAIIIYAARKLGVDGYGIFSYAVGLAGFFVFIKNIGVDAVLTREVAKDPEKQHKYLSTAFWIEIILLVVTFLLIIFIAPIFSGVRGAAILLPFVALALIFDDLRDLFIAFFRGKDKMELEALVMVAANISLAIFGFIVLFFLPTPKLFAMSTAAASLFGLIAATFLIKPFVKGILKNFTKNLVAPILKSALPIAIGGFASVFLFNVDIVMLGWWRDANEIGLYSAAQKIVGMLAIFSGFISVATFSSLSRFVHSDSQQKIKKLVETSLKMIFIVALPLVIGGVVLKDSLIGLLFGASYLPAANAFAILLFSILAVHPLPMYSNILLAFDKQAKLINYAIAASVCNVALNFFLIPKYGIEGASMATLISFLVYIFLIQRSIKYIYDFNFSGLFKAATSALLMGFLAYILNISGIHIIINIVISGAFYFLLLYLIKEPIIKEIFSLFNLKD
ncbi:MAG: flippase [Patescibacteria group bacterium]|nr:flippase [Patescibacteria group bacterium]